MNNNQFDWMLAMITGMIGAQILSIPVIDAMYLLAHTIAPELVDLIKFFGAIVGGLIGSAITMYGKYKMEELKVRREERRKIPPL